MNPEDKVLTPGQIRALLALRDSGGRGRPSSRTEPGRPDVHTPNDPALVNRRVADWLLATGLVRRTSNGVGIVLTPVGWALANEVAS